MKGMFGILGILIFAALLTGQAYGCWEGWLFIQSSCGRSVNGCSGRV